MATQLAFWDSPPARGDAATVPPPVATTPAPRRVAVSPAPEVSAEDPAEIVSNSPSDLLQQLRDQLRRVETGTADKQSLPTVSCGGAALDRLLPRGGLPAASMIEWIAAAPGGGARLLAMLAAVESLRCHPGWLVVVDAAGTFYPPAAVALGIDMERIVWVRPADRSDQVWAIDQSLRCSAVAAVWSPLGAWLDDRDARRFQLAAESGRTMGLFVRPAAVMGQPSFAEVRWHVQGARASSLTTGGRTLRATLARCRGGQIDRSATFAVTEQGIIQQGITDVPSTRPAAAVAHSPQTGSQTALHLAAQLAHPKVAPRRKQSA